MHELSHREIQLAELNILKYFDMICKRNNLKYSLAGGSLLGAIRHKGFIPWDDDIDIMMPRPDYERLIKILRKEGHSQYKLYDVSTENLKLPFIKIIDKRICVNETQDNTTNLWIDIFPLDGLPVSLDKCHAMYKKALKLIKIICWPGIKNYSGRHNIFFAFLINLYILLYTKKKAVKSLNKLAKRYPFGTTSYMGCIVWGLYGVGERMPLTGFSDLVNIDFENNVFNAVSCWHEYLTGIYGDYMQLPPEEKRVCHGFKAYRIEENE